MTKDTIDIRLKLKGKLKEQFLDIKTAKGLTNNTEILRLIINEYHELTQSKEP